MMPLDGQEDIMEVATFELWFDTKQQMSLQVVPSFPRQLVD